MGRLTQHQIDNDEAVKRERARRFGGEDEQSKTLSIRYGKEASVEIRARTAVLASILAIATGGGAMSLRAENRAGAPVAMEQLATRATALEGRTTAVEGEVKDLKGEVRQQRLDQIDQWRWEAMRRDPERVRYLDRRRRELEQP